MHATIFSFQARQMLFDLESSYNAFNKVLHQS